MDALDWTLLVRTIPAEGLDAERNATPDELRALAETFELAACARLAVRYRIRSTGHGRFRISGTLEVDYTQTCVITLEPLVQRIRHAFARDLWPLDLIETPVESIIETLDDEPEPIENGLINLGKLVLDEMSELIDPNPRKPGAALDWQPDADDVPEGPFAKLKSLSRRDT